MTNHDDTHSRLLDNADRELLEAIESENFDWSKSELTTERKQFWINSAKLTKKLRAERKKISLRVPTLDLRAIKQIAEEEGMPYQTLIVSVLHKYAKQRQIPQLPT